MMLMNMHHLQTSALILSVLSGASTPAAADIPFPGDQPGKAGIAIQNNEFHLGNSVLDAAYTYDNGTLRLKGVTSGKDQIVAEGGDLFTIRLKDGRILRSSDMQTSIPASADLAADPKAFKAALRHPGKALSATMTSPDGNLSIQWRAVLRDGSAYLRHELSISAQAPTEIAEITALQCSPAESQSLSVPGNTSGSLVLGTHAFFALETPAARNEIRRTETGTLVEGKWIRRAPLQPGRKWEVSSVIGLLAPGQERRSFLAYFERERAVPHRPFIHYNSWYELNVFRNDNMDPMKRLTEAQTLEVLNAWYEKFYQKRNMHLDAFVWDDGWDDFNSLWDFHCGFPNGFRKTDEQARRQKAGIGAWLGPVGGYHASKIARIKNWNDKHPGNQINNFELANKEYFDAFSGRCLQMVKDYDMRYFKFDGISTDPSAKGPAANREEDVEGILELINTLRAQKPDLFINCTVGTWASPFWYMYADSIWRQGGDYGFAGEGNNREKWITYRDSVVYNAFVRNSPLCPINSIMTHGLMLSRRGAPSSLPNDIESIKHEIRCTFGSGSGIQELYVDHALMTSLGQNEILWDELARSIEWYRSSVDIFADTHWVGGNPWDEQKKTGNIYGWAAWTPEKSSLTLRNPSKSPQSYTATLRQVMDIPAHIRGTIRLANAYDDQRPLDNITGKEIDIDSPITWQLEPFEVFVWNGRTTTKTFSAKP